MSKTIQMKTTVLVDGVKTQENGYPITTPDRVIDANGVSVETKLTGKINEPASEGTAGQVLTTNGSGGRSWTTVQGGGGDNVLSCHFTYNSEMYKWQCDKTFDQVKTAIQAGKDVIGYAMIPKNSYDAKDYDQNYILRGESYTNNIDLNMPGSEPMYNNGELIRFSAGYSHENGVYGQVAEAGIYGKAVVQWTRYNYGEETEKTEQLLVKKNLNTGAVLRTETWGFDFSSETEYTYTDSFPEAFELTGDGITRCGQEEALSWWQQGIPFEFTYSSDKNSPKLHVYYQGTHNPTYDTQSFYGVAFATHIDSDETSTEPYYSYTTAPAKALVIVEKVWSDPIQYRWVLKSGKIGGGTSGAVTDVQVNGTSVVTSGVANINLTDMIGATSAVSGTHGLVPAPNAGDQDKFLRGNGTWAVVGGALPAQAGHSGHFLTTDGTDASWANLSGLPVVSVATGTLTAGNTSLTVNFTGTYISSYVTNQNNEKVITEEIINDSSVVFTINSALGGDLTCKVVATSASVTDGGGKRY